MHWRGDRTGGSGGGDPLDENAAFLTFNVAFPGLLGRDEGELTAADMQAFVDFALRLTYPPNPIRALDNSLSLLAQAGQTLYSGPITDQVANCNGCHVLDRSQGFFGTAGGSTFENESMEFKVPHLRNAYQKVGMFGEPPTDFFPNADGSFMGDQVRATGFLHDGSVSTMVKFLGAGVFSLNDNQQRQLEAFIMEFDSDLAPIVGQQVTLTDRSGSDAEARVELLMTRADTDYYVTQDGIPVKECDLVVKGVLSGEYRGWLYQGGDMFQADRRDEAAWSKNALLALAADPAQPLTFTCVPPGSGSRMGLDRDLDGILDGDDPTPSTPPSQLPVIRGYCSTGPSASSHTVTQAFFLIVLAMLIRLMAVRRVR
jgi:mono/diheme cytochrome c family protein